MQKHEEPINRQQQLLISWSIAELARALSERESYSSRIKAQVAARYLAELDASFEPNEVELTEEEGRLSGYLHTMLRKGEDSGASAVLHRMVREDRAKNIWRKFVKKSLAARRSPCLDPLTSDNFEDATMHFLLSDWSESNSFLEHMKNFRESL